MEKIDLFLKINNKKIDYVETENIHKAVKNIFSELKNFNENKDKIFVILSPACASYDQFKNFEERGDYFKKLISEKLKVNKSIFLFKYHFVIFRSVITTVSPLANIHLIS